MTVRLVAVVALCVLLTGCAAPRRPGAVRTEFARVGLPLRSPAHGYYFRERPFRKLLGFIDLEPAPPNYVLGHQPDVLVFVFRSASDAARTFTKGTLSMASRGLSRDLRQSFIRSRNVVADYFEDIEPRELAEIKLAMARLR
jgi:hypothetical protein